MKLAIGELDLEERSAISIKGSYWISFWLRNLVGDEKTKANKGDIV